MVTSLPTSNPGTSKRWTAASIPDLSGKLAIVTGASAGIGYEIAVQLAARGAHVVLASRREAATRAAAERVMAAVPEARVDVRPLDLSSLASVRRFGDEIAGRHRRIDILVNNAGIAGGPRRATEDGFEFHFQVNYLAHFALTGVLWPLLRAARGRVVHVSSEIAARGRIQFEDLQHAGRYHFISAYAQSKLANLLFAFELERRTRRVDAGVSSFAAHPGVARTDLMSGKEADWGRSLRGVERIVRLVQIVLAQPAARSALSILYQATERSAESSTYVGPSRGKRGHPGPQPVPRAARDAPVAARLWSVSQELSGVTYEGLP